MRATYTVGRTADGRRFIARNGVLFAEEPSAPTYNAALEAAEALAGEREAAEDRFHSRVETIGFWVVVGLLAAGAAFG